MSRQSLADVVADPGPVIVERCVLRILAQHLIGEPCAQSLIDHHQSTVEEAMDRGDGHDDDVDDARVRSCSHARLERLDSRLGFVMAMKLAGASDAEVGEALEVSRRTATNRKAAAYAVTAELLQPLPHPERLIVLDHVAPALHNALVQSRSRTP